MNYHGNKTYTEKSTEDSLQIAERTASLADPIYKFSVRKHCNSYASFSANPGIRLWRKSKRSSKESKALKLSLYRLYRHCRASPVVAFKRPFETFQRVKNVLRKEEKVLVNKLDQYFNVLDIFCLTRTITKKVLE